VTLADVRRIALDLRDSPLNPQSGFYSSLSFQEAGSYLLGGDFQFLKVVWANEGYVPLDLLTRWVFAARFRVGAIYNNEPVETNEVGDTQADPIPIENRLYGGGANSLRGLGRNNLSFFRVGNFRPDRPASVDTVEVIPIGGLTLAEASFEPRFRLMRDLAGVGPLWGLAFFDVATILEQQLFYSTTASESLGIGSADFSDITDSLISAVGAGAFWLTPVGPVRADFSVTLNDLSNDPRFRTCGPASRVRDEVSQTGRSDCEFLPVERDPVQQQINLDYSFFIGVGHSF
jgi:outer membrane protein assembly factor BamA